MPLATILIEDSAMIRESLISALVELAEADVIAVAGTAADGIAALKSHADRWQLVVVDMFLQRGNGLEVLHAVRDRRVDQHALVLTNYATAEIRRRSAAAGADAVFDKSTEIDAFLAQCRAYASAPGASAPVEGR
jgi:DNA-binding NarL/FixJ family response regulator